MPIDFSTLHTPTLEERIIQELESWGGQFVGISNLQSQLNHGSTRAAVQRLAACGRIYLTPGRRGRGHAAIITLTEARHD